MIMAVMKHQDNRPSKVRERGAETSVTVEAAIRGRFQRSPYLPLRNISCTLDHGVLSLRGRVPTYYLKQLAQTIGGSFEGVRHVSNELHVDFPDRAYRTNR